METHMALLDHFNRPLNRTHPWRSFHSAWAAAMARLLNGGVLPAGYYAVPTVDREGPIEIDVATLKESESWGQPARSLASEWIPDAPGLAVAIDLPRVETVEVEVFFDDGEPRLAAAVELVSPRNKDRPQARQAFAVKCVSYLQQGVSVALVDTVTTRRSDMCSSILSLLGVEAASGASLVAAALRAVRGEEEEHQLQMWSLPLALGQGLPTLPLWIATELAVPLDLDASYRATCVDLRIRHAS
jgi:hypothetical protein